MARLEFQEPKRLPEANILAEFYCQCKASGVHCVLEYTYAHSRLDAVIVKDGLIVAIVEVKSYSNDRPPNTKTKQFEKYRRFGVPLFWITRVNQVPKVVSEIQDFLAYSFPDTEEDTEEDIDKEPLLTKLLG